MYPVILLTVILMCILLTGYELILNCYVFHDWPRINWPRINDFVLTQRLKKMTVEIEISARQKAISSIVIKYSSLPISKGIKELHEGIK